MGFYWVFPISVFVLFWVLFLKIVFLLWWKPRRIEKHFAEQGIGGPPYRFFIGNVREMVDLMAKNSKQPPNFSHNILPRVLGFYHHWKKIYGATFLMWFGPTARVTVSNPVLIREIFTSRSEFFEKIDPHPLIRQLEGDGLLYLKGEKWARHRKIISGTFQAENLKLWTPALAESVVKMMEKWIEISNSGEVEIEVTEWFLHLTEDIVTRTVFGQNFGAGKKIFRLQSQQMSFASEAYGKVFIPGYSFFPTKKNMITWRLDKEIKKLLTKLINLRKESNGATKRMTTSEKNSRDLIDLMINADADFIGESPAISDQDIIEECKTFFFAGKQTVSYLLTWTTVLLAMHPEWQDRARDEVFQICGPRDIPSKDDLSKLKTLAMIVNESLRLYPPTVATIRRTKTEVDLGGHRIPAGTELLIPIIAVHHDQTLWGPDVDQFNPDRFAKGSSRAASHPMAFIPFGVGTRTCVGRNLALLEAKLAMAIILQRFSFKLSQNYQHVPAITMFLHPMHGAQIVFRQLSAGSGYEL